jgi:hypothetical protein
MLFLETHALIREHGEAFLEAYSLARVKLLDMAEGMSSGFVGSAPKFS